MNNAIAAVQLDKLILLLLILLCSLILCIFSHTIGVYFKCRKLYSFSARVFLKRILEKVHTNLLDFYLSATDKHWHVFFVGIFRKFLSIPIREYKKNMIL